MFAFAKSAFADEGESGELAARSTTSPLIARPFRALLQQVQHLVRPTSVTRRAHGCKAEIEQPAWHAPDRALRHRAHQLLRLGQGKPLQKEVICTANKYCQCVRQARPANVAQGSGL